jgi:pilus assembly protein Flp/PilA
MMTMMKRGKFEQRLRRQQGASAVEYGLIIALIAVAIILTVTALGGGLDGLFQQVLDALPGG